MNRAMRAMRGGVNREVSATTVRKLLLSKVSPQYTAEGDFAIALDFGCGEL
jgi:hypothetical protein